jgi:hypothetical protein
MASPVAAEGIGEYIRATDIDQLFKHVLTRCFRARPADPIAFVFDYLIETYPELASARGVGLLRTTTRTRNGARLTFREDAHTDVRDSARGGVL